MRSSMSWPGMPSSDPTASSAIQPATVQVAAAVANRIQCSADLRVITVKSKSGAPGRQREMLQSARSFSVLAIVRQEAGKMGTLVSYATDKGVAVLTLTDPPVNAYTHEMFKELDANVLEARFDDDVHVIVVTGLGDKYFCAGANVNVLKEADETFKYYFCLHANETLLRLENTPKLVIASINGHCVGGGLELALACDLRVA